jgi:hypothetical protein
LVKGGDIMKVIKYCSDGCFQNGKVLARSLDKAVVYSVNDMIDIKRGLFRTEVPNTCPECDDYIYITFEDSTIKE